MSVCPDNGIGWEIESFGPAFMLQDLVLLVNAIVLSGSCGAPINVSEGRPSRRSQPNPHLKQQGFMLVNRPLHAGEKTLIGNYSYIRLKGFFLSKPCGSPRKSLKCQYKCQVHVCIQKSYFYDN